MCLGLAIKRPNDVLARGEHAGFEWMVVQNGRGYRCGYVRVPVGHPWHGKSYHDVDADAHGGLTFDEPDEPCDKGGPDNAHWFGFDCAHAGDAPDPALPGCGNRESVEDFFSIWGIHSDGGGTVRTQEYVEAECRSLCEQAQRAEAT